MVSILRGKKNLHQEMVGGLARPCPLFSYGPGITDVNDDVSLSPGAETVIYQEPIIRHRNLK